MPKSTSPRARDFQRIIGYAFRDEDLLRLALVHRSHVNEERGESAGDNERLEFLGDAVLQLAASDYLLRHYPGLDEGDLSKKRSALVREESLSTAAGNLKLGKFLVLGHGEEASGGRSKPSILAGALEAVLGAVYLDGGYEAARQLVEVWLERFLGAAGEREVFPTDFKSHLQELCQARFRTSPQYLVLATAGPEHQKMFEVGVRLEGRLLGFGRGRSKKEAEQNAACDVLLGMEAPRPEKRPAKGRR